MCRNFIFDFNFSDLNEYRDVVGDISIAVDNDEEESDSIISSSMSPSKQSTTAPSTGNTLLFNYNILLYIVIRLY